MKLSTERDRNMNSNDVIMAIDRGLMVSFTE